MGERVSVVGGTIDWDAVTVPLKGDCAKAVFIGCPPDTPLSIGELQVREMQVLTVFRYAHVYAKAIAMLESGLINVKPIITNHFDFDDSVAAFDFMASDPPEDTIKSVIHLP